MFFEYKDYKDGAKKKVMALDGEEFLRRFCLHILPKGFRKIRQYGFLSNAAKSKSLVTARLALGQAVRPLLTRKERKTIAQKRLFGQEARENSHLCSCCKKGNRLRILEWQPPDYLT